jgi:hypothetical protein
LLRIELRAEVARGGRDLAFATRINTELVSHISF